MTALLDSRGEGTLLSTRLDVVTELVRLGEGRLDSDALDHARHVLERSGERLRLSGEHTVIALAGATGSGKSSLFNAVAGIDLSPVGVRRPTTGAAHACVWGLEGSRSLLEWLGVQKRHRYARKSALDSESGSSLHGLVLLDLPDHDSTMLQHRLEVDRLVTVADLIIWVVDPQKYADAAVHERYLRRLGNHGAVTAVVLNHVDVLTAAEAAECVDDLAELLAADGFTDPLLLATSARTGTGMGELRGLIDETLARRRAAADRLAADLDGVMAQLSRYGEEPPAAISPSRRGAVVARLDEAAGVTAAAHAAERKHRQRGMNLIGWPPAKLVHGLRRDPFRRVGQQAKADLRIAAPDHVPAQQAMVHDALHDLEHVLTGELPEPWSAAVRRAGRSRADTLPDVLGNTVASSPEDTRQPSWWRVVWVVQWLIALYALAGIVWAGCLLGFGYAAAGSTVPLVLRDTALLPYAFLATAEALLAGAFTAWLAGRGVTRGARERRHEVRARMMQRVEDAAAELVFAPMQRELDRYAEFHRALRGEPDGGADDATGQEPDGAWPPEEEAHGGEGEPQAESTGRQSAGGDHPPSQ